MEPHDEEIDGGEGGGALLLKRSELAILRKHSSRYPIVEEERKETVEEVMKVLRNPESSPRNKLAAAKTMGALDAVNLREMELYLAAKKTVHGELQPAINIKQQINLQGLGADELRKLLELRRSLVSPKESSNGNGHTDTVGGS